MFNGEKFFVNYKMNCDVKNCIYVIRCEGCSEIYIGETVNFRLRTNLHKNHVKKNEGLYVSTHIHSCKRRANLLYNFRIMPFYKIRSTDPIFRKQMENNFIQKYKPKLNRGT